LRENARVSSSAVTYRPQRALVTRLFGIGIIAMAFLVFATTVVLTVAKAPEWVLVIVVLAYIVGLVVLGTWAVRSAWIVRFDDDGYRVKMVRDAGVRAASWDEVADLAATEPNGIPCLVLTLTDGRTTTIPVEVMEGDREQFVRDVRDRLKSTQPPLQP
jgi:type IV secretory pathway VirB3-like protein